MVGLRDGLTFTVQNVTVPGGIISELITTSDMLGFGLAFAAERWARLHQHPNMCETYVVVRGWIKVFSYNGKIQILQPIESVEIPVGVPHRIMEASEDALVAVFTLPAYDPANVEYLDED